MLVLGLHRVDADAHADIEDTTQANTAATTRPMNSAAIMSSPRPTNRGGSDSCVRLQNPAHFQAVAELWSS